MFIIRVLRVFVMSSSAMKQGYCYSRVTDFQKAREPLILNPHSGNHIVVINLGDEEEVQDQCNFIPSPWGQEGGREFWAC